LKREVHSIKKIGVLIYFYENTSKSRRTTTVALSVKFQNYLYSYWKCAPNLILNCSIFR